MNNQKLFKFIGITFLITWVSHFTRSILSNLNIITANSIPGLLLYGLGILGPTFAAYICLENPSPKRFIKMIFNHKKGTAFYLIGLSILYLSSYYFSTFKLNPDYPLYLAPVVFIVMFFFGGCNEEVGWSGILYPELEKKFNPPVSTLITFLIWFCWHMPLFITRGDMHETFPLTTFIFLLFTLSLMKTALFRKTSSVCYCAIIHTLSNVAQAIFLYEVNMVMVIISVIIWIISIILWYYPKNDEDNDLKKEEIIEDKKEEFITPIKNPELTTAFEVQEEIEELI